VGEFTFLHRLKIDEIIVPTMVETYCIGTSVRFVIALVEIKQIHCLNDLFKLDCLCP
jgi:hypothetical protein